MALHVYGVVSAATPLPGVLRGRREAPVRLVVHGDLAAVVSEVDADARIRRDDLLTHARVLESLVEGATVLPMRFGVIVENDEEARNILEAGESGLTDSIALLRWPCPADGQGASRSRSSTEALASRAPGPPCAPRPNRQGASVLSGSAPAG